MQNIWQLLTHLAQQDDIAEIWHISTLQAHILATGFDGLREGFTPEDEVPPRAY